MSRFQCASGIHALRRTKRAAVARVAQIDRLELHGHLEELPQLRAPMFSSFLPRLGDREDDEVVVEALGVAEPVQCVRHRLRPLPMRPAPAGRRLVMRPSPMLVLARSSDVAELLEDRRDHVLFAVLVAPRADAERDDRVDALLDFPHQADDLFGPLDRHLDLDDGRHQLLVQDVFAERAGGDVGHQRRDRVLLLERDARLGQRPAHLLNLAEPDADARAGRTRW